MKKILFIGDPHITHNHLSDDIKMFRWIEAVIVEHRPDLVINLGDTFDTHSIIRSECLSLFKSHVDIVCRDLNTEMICVLGNHDMYKPNDATYHALKPFIGLHNNLKIIEKPEVIDEILYVPYLTDSQTWPDIEAKIAVTHNTFLGADFSFRRAEKGLDIKRISSDIIVSGHVHKRHTLTESRPGRRDSSVFYTGTPRALSATDAGQLKGLSIMQIDGNREPEWTFIPSIFPNWRKETIPVTTDLNSILTNPEDHYIVELVGTKAEIKALLASKEVDLLKKEYDLSFRSSPTDISKIDKAQIKAVTVDKMVEEYLNKVYSGNDADLIKEEFGRYYGNTGNN